MPVIPLKLLSYDDVQDLRRVIDVLNANFRYLDWLINYGNLDEVNLAVDKLVGDVFLEFDAKGLTSPCDFVFKNHYATEPFVFLGIESDNVGAFTQPLSLIASPLTALDSNNVRYYYGVRAVVVGSYPTDGNHKISMLAVCMNKIY